MAVARSLGALVVLGFGKALRILTGRARSGLGASDGVPTEIPGHDFLDRAWGFRSDRPAEP